MTMAIFREDITQSYDLFDSPAESYSALAENSVHRSAKVPITEAKLRVPETGNTFIRRRLTDVLKRNAANSAGSLIIGRSGAGKTYLAAQFVRQISDVLWYSLDAGDTDWSAFQRYFRIAVLNELSDKKAGRKQTFRQTDPTSPVDLFADISNELGLRRKEWPSIMVLDGIHHLFDCDWFPEFFDLLIASPPHSSHVIMLSRSRPPNPIWRLRSKQILSFVDEKILSFSPGEAAELFVQNGLSRDEGDRAFAESFGRAGKLIKILEERKSK